MKSNDLVAALAPFTLLSNRNALATAYRCLEISPSRISGAASYAALDVLAELGITDTFFVEAASFIAIAKSLPDDQEVVLGVEDGALRWECGSASGQLALAEVEEMPRNKNRKWGAKPFKPSAEFMESLELGGMSCGGDSMASAGLFGVAITNSDGRNHVYSSDNVTISTATSEEPFVASTDALTLSPEAIKLIQAVAADGARMEYDDNTIYYADSDTRLMVKTISPIKEGVLAAAGRFPAGKMQVDLPSERIASFVKRATALTEDKKGARVNVGVHKSSLMLSFADALASSEEHLLVSGLKAADRRIVSLDASRLVRAMQHASKLDLSYLDQSVLVLVNPETDFRYIISGRAA